MIRLYVVIIYGQYHTGSSAHKRLQAETVNARIPSRNRHSSRWRKSSGCVERALLLPERRCTVGEFTRNCLRNCSYFVVRLKDPTANNRSCSPEWLHYAIRATFTSSGTSVLLRPLPGSFVLFHSGDEPGPSSAPARSAPDHVVQPRSIPAPASQYHFRRSACSK